VSEEMYQKSQDSLKEYIATIEEKEKEINDLKLEQAKLSSRIKKLEMKADFELISEERAGTQKSNRFSRNENTIMPR
jgi:hypothetical protein